MDSSTLVLGLRVLLALACVLGVLWFLARRASGTGAVRRSRQAALSVVAKQSLGGRTGVAIVEVSGRRLLLGVSEHGVNLLTEVEMPEPEEAGVRERVALDPAALAGLDELDALPASADDAVVPDDLRGLAALPDAPERASSTPSTPAARMPAVPTPRNPLEGSVLDAKTWRQAVVAVQERTIRR